MDYQTALNNLITSIGTLSLVFALVGTYQLLAKRNNKPEDTRPAKYLIYSALAYILITMFSQVIGQAINNFLAILS